MRPRSSFWLKVTIGVAALIMLLGLLLVGISLVLWRVDSLNAARVAAVLQASAAAAGLVGSGALVGVTAYYAWVSAETLRRSGPDVRVDLKRGWTDSASGVITAPLDGRQDAPMDERFTRALWAISAHNAGGAAVTIESVALELHQGKMSFMPTETIQTSLPHRLASHASVAIYFETPEGAMTRMAELFNLKKHRMRATCELGSGEFAVSEWRVIPPTG